MLGRPRLIPYGCEEMMYFLLRCYLMEDLGPLGDASTPECSRLKKLLLVKPLNKFSVFLLSLLHLGKTIRADMLPYNSYIKKKSPKRRYGRVYARTLRNIQLDITVSVIHKKYRVMPLIFMMFQLAIWTQLSKAWIMLSTE